MAEAAPVVDQTPCSEAQPPLVALLTRLLQPLARLLLKRGMTIYEFNEIARWTFVQAAMEKQHFGVAGREAWSTTKARTAVLSGLTRREVDRLAKLPGPSLAAVRDHYHRSGRLLKAWMQTPGFQNEAGQPRELPVKGRTGSLEYLVRRHCRDTTVRAMLDELEARGCVIRTSKTTVRLASREYVDLSLNAADSEPLCEHAEQFMSALEQRANGKCLGEIRGGGPD